MPSPKVAIVGAGPSGIVSAVEFRRAGWQVVWFERSDRIGGVFSHSWDGLRFVSSSAITDFSTFDHPRFDRSKAVFYSAPEYVDYLRAYLDDAGVSQGDILFRHAVVAAELRDDGRIGVHARPLDGPDGPNGPLRSETVDHLVVCGGLHSHPSNLPALPGLDDFEGRVLRSTAFRDAEAFRGARVVVVGGGESASDIADLVSRVADQTYVSTRRGTGVVIPRFDIHGRANDLYTTRAFHAMPRHRRLGGLRIRGTFKIDALIDRGRSPSTDPTEQGARRWARRMNTEPGQLRSPYRRFGTKTLGMGRAVARGAIENPAIVSMHAGGVRFEDGSHVDCDAVIFAVGFRAPRFSSIAGLPDVRLNALYLRMIPVDSEWTGKLSCIGFARPAIGAIPPLSELQARLAVEIANGRHTLPDAREMQAAIEARDALLRSRYPLDFPQREALVEFVSYAVDLARTLGCEPDHDRLLRSDPRLYLRVHHGPFHGAQFRLFGPGAMYAEARERLMALPRIHAPSAAWIGAVNLAGEVGHRLGIVGDSAW